MNNKKWHLLDYVRKERYWNGGKITRQTTIYRRKLKRPYECTIVTTTRQIDPTKNS